MSSSGERVLCEICSEKVIRKNLKTHFLRRHPGVPVKFKSATSENIVKFFDGPAMKKIKYDHDSAAPSTSKTYNVQGVVTQEQACTTATSKTDNEPKVPTTPTSSTCSSNDNVLFDSTQITILLDKVRALTDALGGDEGFKKVNTAPLLPTADSKELTFEEKLDLITASRSIDNLLKWAHYFVKSEYGILCSVCGTVLQYDYNNGENFTESAMPDSENPTSKVVSRITNDLGQSLPCFKFKK